MEPIKGKFTKLPQKETKWDTVIRNEVAHNGRNENSM